MVSSSPNTSSKSIMLDLLATGDVKIEKNEAHNRKHNERKFQHLDSTIRLRSRGREPPIG